MAIIFMLDPSVSPEALGFTPDFLDPDDPRPAREQFNENYAHGGGWRPQNGFKMRGPGRLEYPGDPPLVPFAIMQFRKEWIVFYPFSYVAIVQPDGSFEAARMD